MLNDANNHSFDFGAAGQAQTVRSIHAAGLAQTGLPGEITRVKAGGVTVAFVAFAPYPYTASLLDLPAARALIQQARRQAQLVVVYMHAGAEGAAADHVTGREETYLGEDRGNPEAFAHMAIDAGASLVIASGPHVLRGMQFYQGHLIAYSLGNFAGYGNFSVHGTMTMSAILQVTLSSSGRFEQGPPVLPSSSPAQGRPARGGGAAAFVGQLSAADFGRTAARIALLRRHQPRRADISPSAAIGHARGLQPRAIPWPEGGTSVMAKALLGHVRGPDQRLAVELRRAPPAGRRPGSPARPAGRTTRPPARRNPGRAARSRYAAGPPEAVGVAGPGRTSAPALRGQGVRSRRMQTRGQRSRPSAISCARTSRSPGVISASRRTRNPHRS